MTQFLIEYHKDRLEQAKLALTRNCEDCGSRTPPICDRHLVQFSHQIDFIKANIPAQSLKTLTEEDIFDKIVSEYSLVDGSFSPPQPVYEHIVGAYIDKIDTTVVENGYSFIFFGQNGSGKTQTAIHILASAIEAGLSGYYVFFKDLINLYTKGEFRDDKVSMALYQYIMNCDMLVIDEVGKESSVTENLLGAFEQIIKHRTGMSKPTIMLTNLPFQKKEGGFLDKYKNSVYNSLLQFYRVVNFSKDGNFRTAMRKEWDL